MGRFFAETLLTAVLLGGIVLIPLWQSGGYGEDFVQDYLSAHALLAGHDPYQDLVALREMNGFPPSHGQSVPFNPHPPLAIVITLPVAGLPFFAAWRVLQIIQVVAFAAAWSWIGRLFSCSGWRFAAAGGAFALWAPFWQGLDWGQPVGVITLIATALWYFFRRANATAAGAALASACMVRPFFILAATAASSWRPRQIFLLAGSSIVVVGCGFGAVGTWPLTWMHKAELVAKFTADCGSIPGVLGMSAAASTALFAVAGALLAVLFRMRRETACAIPMALTSAMITYPLAWFHYDVTLIPVVVWGIATSHRSTNRFALWAVILFVIVRSVPNLSGEFRWQLWVQCGGRLALLTGIILIERHQNKNNKQ